MPYSLLQRYAFLPYCLLLLVILVFPLFFMGGPDWMSSPLVRALWDFGHIVFFALLIFTAQAFVNLQRPAAWLLVSAGAALVGMGIEWLQVFFGRDASWQDVGRNLIGVWIGLFWGQPSTRRVRFMRLVSLLLLMPSLGQLGQITWLHSYTARQFPLLTDFESKVDAARAHGRVSLSTEQYAHGRASLKITLDRRFYSGTGLHYLLGDWRGYRYLTMELFNPEPAALPMVVRITDALHDRGENNYHDRFNLPITLQQGWNTIRIPLDHIEQAPRNRLMALDQIRRIDIFASGFAPGRVLYWDYLRLE